MIAHKHITKIIAAGMAAAVCLCLCTVAFSGPIAAAAGETGITMAYETALFDTSSVLEVNIRMDEADWNDMLANAAAEEYYQCDVEIGGTTFYRVAIRPKGNTSLTSIASDPTTDRYSFKLEFDHYVDGQTCFGLDISACRDRGIGDVDGCVCSIAEHAVAVLRGGIDSRVFDRDGRAVRRQQRGVHAVEVAVLRRSRRADHSAHRRAGCRPGAYPADRLRRPAACRPVSRAAFRRKHRRMRSRLPDYQPQRPPRCCRRP